MVAVAQPATPLLTADDLLAMPSDDLVHRELWKGRLVEMSPAGGPHGRMFFALMAALAPFVKANGLGEIWGGEIGYVLQRSPDTVAVPDLAFVPHSVASAVSLDDQGFHAFVPPLVIEVKSPTDREAEIAQKLVLYLEAGVQEIWWLRPRQRTLTRHWPDRGPVVLGIDDTLDAVEALPGFSLALAELFASGSPATAP
jgi:Uma2 family endonuclease